MWDKEIKQSYIDYGLLPPNEAELRMLNNLLTFTNDKSYERGYNDSRLEAGTVGNIF
jgi:hypothetical protein